MGILDDIKRLGLEIDDETKVDLEALFDRAKAETGDELVTKTKVEYYIGEYLTQMRPDIMTALEKDRQNRNNELLRDLSKTHDEQGRRICDEITCSSVQGVGECAYCGRFVCKDHNYPTGGKDQCCYACHIEYTEKSKSQQKDKKKK